MILLLKTPPNTVSHSTYISAEHIIDWLFLHVRCARVSRWNSRLITHTRVNMWNCSDGTDVFQTDTQHVSLVRVSVVLGSVSIHASNKSHNGRNHVGPLFAGGLVFVLKYNKTYLDYSFQSRLHRFRMKIKTRCGPYESLLTQTKRLYIHVTVEMCTCIGNAMWKGSSSLTFSTHFHGFCVRGRRPISLLPHALSEATATWNP